MDKLTLKLELTVYDSDINDIMDTALQGISYWANAEAKGGLRESKYLSDVLTAGGIITITSAEEEAEFGPVNLTKAAFLGGLQAWFEQGDNNNALEANPMDGSPTVDAGQIDAGDADVIIQLSVFGEVVYG